jgi:hypothetical protein
VDADAALRERTAAPTDGDAPRRFRSVQKRPGPVTESTEITERSERLREFFNR